MEMPIMYWSWLANFSKFDLEFDVDPLFKKTSTQFDSGGGASSQFLYNLNIRDSTRSELLLDSNAVPGAEHINFLAPTQVCSLTQISSLHAVTGIDGENFLFLMKKLKVQSVSDRSFLDIRRTLLKTGIWVRRVQLDSMRSIPESPTQLSSLLQRSQISHSGTFLLNSHTNRLHFINKTTRIRRNGR